MLHHLSLRASLCRITSSRLLCLNRIPPTPRGINLQVRGEARSAGAPTDRRRAQTRRNLHHRPTEREQREVAAVGAAVRIERRQGLWPRLSRFRREEADVEDASSRAQSARHRLRPAAGSCEPTYIAFSPRENMIDAARDGPRPQLRRVDACGRQVKPCRRGPPVSWSDLRLKPSSHAGLPLARGARARGRSERPANCNPHIHVANEKLARRRPSFCEVAPHRSCRLHESTQESAYRRTGLKRYTGWTAVSKPSSSLFAVEVYREATANMTGPLDYLVAPEVSLDLDPSVEVSLPSPLCLQTS